MGSVLMRVRGWLVALGLACVGLAGPSAQAQDSGMMAIEAGEVTLEALPSQPLPAGRCGMFLWSRGDQPMFVLVAYSNPGEAMVRADGRNRFMRRTAIGGEPQFGHFERQTFADGRLTIGVEVEFDPERPLTDGAIVRQGVLRLRDRRGWDTIVPVGGMVACRGASDTEQR